MARLIKRSGTEEVNAMFYLLLRTFINPQQPLRSEFSITPAYLLRSLMFGWRKFHEGEKEFSKYRQRNPIMPLGFPDGEPAKSRLGYFRARMITESG
jgi:hypothetical protein